MKFDESKIINALHTDRAVVGSKGFFADKIIELKLMVEEGDCIQELKDVITEGCPYPFKSDAGNFFDFFYPVEIAKRKKLVSFTWEDREMLRGKWYRKKGKENEYTITLLNRFSDGTFGIDAIPAENFLTDCEFLDGSPCGKEVEE
ncbi:hypothetical protein [Fibrobacter intestinalis]|uniref:Uncharacterized protein n=1 Tax=Fibrobacter intestinalis TaxID=28122 RepID=A0A1T4MWD1_9BACT|nr:MULTISPECIES: hypothetical protein [Fibrobacter]PBC73084.1 hypothetical protein BGW94_0673 [Fibrobacter sp. NR9]PBC75311.1 hypothetical protein BGW94_2999 [Fibrobacter sp. NR9]SJZ57296.1 hypothetical protein SAMN02745108_00978 [Fibrobacter intestinalis]SJZ71154.1 hypothetical protein SAMN02745108_01410 [Fibrobacter intestinalis]